MMDMGVQFLPQHKTWMKDSFRQMIQRDGRQSQSQTDYILGTYRRFFQEVAIQDTRHHLGHYMVLGYLRRDPVIELTSQMGITTSPLPYIYGNLPLPSNWECFYGNFVRFYYQKLPYYLSNYYHKYTIWVFYPFILNLGESIYEITSPEH